MINNTSLSANTSLRTAIKNDLRLNYQTKLWLDVISMPAIELKEKIEKTMEENPFLEYDVKENLNRLYDFCRTSNPMSKGTELLEKEIIEEAQHLNNMIINGACNEEIFEASAKIRALMTQRNAGI